MVSSVKRRAGQLEPERVEKCPACRAANPDLEQGTICASCGAVMPAEPRRQLRKALMAMGAGGAAAALGFAIAVAAGGSLKSLAIALFLAGGGLAVFGGLAMRQVIAAVGGRESEETRGFLSRIDKITAALLSGFVVVPILVGLFGFRDKLAEGRAVTALPTFDTSFNKDDLTTYSTIVLDRGDTVDANVVGEPRTIGKVVVLDRGDESIPGVKEGELSTVMTMLPPDLRAAKPVEVGTVVWLSWSTEYSASYSQSTAYVVDCVLTLIDASKKVVIGRESFTGGPPPRQVERGKDGYGSRPLEEIVAYLKGLPHAETSTAAGPEPSPEASPDAAPAGAAPATETPATPPEAAPATPEAAPATEPAP